MFGAGGWRCSMDGSLSRSFLLAGTPLDNRGRGAPGAGYVRFFAGEIRMSSDALANTNPGTHTRILETDPNTANVFPVDGKTLSCNTPFPERSPQVGGGDVSVSNTLDSLAQSPRGTYPNPTLGNPSAAVTPETKFTNVPEGVGGKRRSRRQRRRQRTSAKKSRKTARGRKVSRKTRRRSRK